MRKGRAVFFGTIEEGIEVLFGSIEEGSEALSGSIEEQGIEDVSREEEKKEQRDQAQLLNFKLASCTHSHSQGTQQDILSRISLQGWIIKRKQTLYTNTVSILLAVIFTGIVISGILFVAYLTSYVFRFIASHETIHPPEFHVNSATVNPLYFSNSTFPIHTAVWNLTFSFKNPNTIDMSYKGFDVSLYYGKDFLSSVPIGPFKHEELETTEVKVTIDAPLASYAAKTIEDELITNKAVNFDVRIRGVIKGQILHFF
ncbi:hypothetical protein Dsin_007954 [Dipteronia sinensis]|uniref:Late embryogenesis abundant protein LEA-2 subgroup domain-containing protein n=1 Tax=Dipteronia sinensis TaxID=43782 RepID=A0AAE0B1H9_9ROSI|nr:hypothetical protein Dsin_007954 [Dipteronia sinensis]